MPENPSLEKSLAIIGDEDTVLGFQALGFRIYPLRELQEAKAALEEIVQQKCAVCLVQDNIYLAAQEEINNYSDLPFPVFVPFSKNGEKGLLETMFRAIRLRATGTN
jgi:V/A-type H+-transporting ATPase subunit F